MILEETDMENKLFYDKQDMRAHGFVCGLIGFVMGTVCGVIVTIIALLGAAEFFGIQ